jgi:ADP-heptose:LPS heptosyltransferase
MQLSLEKAPGKQIKVMASGGLGDCLLLSPFFRYFRNSGRYNKIVCATPAIAMELFDKNPNIDLVIPCPGRDLYIWGLPEKDCTVFSPYMKIKAPDKLGANMNLEATPTQRFNQIDKSVVRQVAEQYGMVLEDETLEIFTTELDENLADKIMRPFLGKPLVFINRASSYKEKEYPILLWQEVVNHLHNHVNIVEFATKTEALKGTQVIGPMPGIRVSAAIYKRLSCVVTVDSFPQHLACAVGTPAVALFGATNPKAFGHSANTNIRAVLPDLQSDGARDRGFKQSTRMGKMENIDPKIVAEATLNRCFDTHSEYCQKAVWGKKTHS